MGGQRRFSRFALFGLAATLLALVLISLVGVTETRQAVGLVADSGSLADAYSKARLAISSEESLGRLYRLQPGQDVRDRQQSTDAEIAQALGEILAAGAGADDVAVVAKVRAEHAQYRIGLHRLFAAVDRGDIPTTKLIADTEVDPTFRLMQEQIDRAAAVHVIIDDTATTRLERIQRRVSAVTTAGFAVGVALVVTFGAVLGGYQRALVRQSNLNRHQALHDALTGLPNRMLFADRVGQALALAARTDRAVAVMLIDLDRFKDVNDTLGHAFGDLLLRQVGPRVQRELRRSDTLARLGGDEFGVLLPDFDAAAAGRVAERVLATLHVSFQLDELSVDLEASIGVAVAPRHGDGAEELVRHADVAMYAAKQSRGGVVVYDPDQDLHTPGRLLLLGDLRRALDRPGELVMHYQPKVDLVGERLCGVEALLRWQHPERGMVPPGEFIPSAENTGLIHRLTTHVLTLAIGQARKWIDGGYRVPVAVNLSARCLLDLTLPDRVAALLLACDVPATLLRLEITESAVMIDPARSLIVLHALHDLGIRLSIDDYGTGYSSMAYLKELPVDELKIDKSFVQELTTNDQDAVIVRGAIDLGHNLGMTVVAEGVETEQQVQILAELGCDIAQGYHFARPMPPDQLASWLLDHGVVPLPEPATAVGLGALDRSPGPSAGDRSGADRPDRDRPTGSRHSGNERKNRL